MSRVKLEEVRKVYENGFTAVHGASFEVDAGEFLVLVGPSGCGKSTLLRMIAGLETITGGRLYIGDRLVNDVQPKDRDIAMVFQNYALYPHMSVRENLAFGLKLRKHSRAEIEERVRRAAGILGLEPVLDRKPRQLSGGQRQRVAVGRAIVRQPQVFLFDEPLSNLDAKLRVQTRKEISRLQRQLAATTIYVTHDQTEAMTMGDRIVVLREGRVQQIGTPLELYEHPVNRFVAGFIGSPSMNFVEGEIVREGGLRFRVPGDSLSVELGGGWEPAVGSRAGRPVTLGIRPEHVHLAEGTDASAAVVTATLDAVEPMGNETFVYARVADREVVARVPPVPLPAPGEPISLALDPARIHLFDPESGEAIGSRG